MRHSAEMKRCLEQVDVDGVRRLWAHVAPHLPQPKTDLEGLVTLHHARTQVPTIALKLRAYSHCWLLDHGYPSGLPDDLRPRAERMYPRVAEGVGIAVRGNSEIGRAIAPIVQGAMSDAVADVYADVRSPEPVLVKVRIQEARAQTLRKLLGGKRLSGG